MDTLRLSKLNEYIQRVVALNFEHPIWVTAELVQVKINRGHCYLEVAEKSEDNDILAQSSAVIWKSNWEKIKTKIPEEILQEGAQLKLLILVEFHPRYGLKLIVQDIDSSYTLGELKKQREATIARLISENLWQANKKQKLPAIIKHIAVITSLTAAGRIDFEEHIINNAYGYTFKISYYPATMQGPGAISEIPTKISQINKNQYDCVVIIRGGGAKLDLIDFDHYEIAKQISNCNFPVLTGIGHQQDESIADLNAYESLKTPTAVADYIVEHNMKFENLILNHFQIIVEQIQLITHKKSEKHSALINQIKLSAHQWLTNKKNARTGIYHNLKEYSTNKLHQLKISLLEHTHTLSNNDPLEILKKGYAITYQNSKKIKNIKQLKENEPIEIVYIDGQAFGTIQSKTNHKND